MTLRALVGLLLFSGACASRPSASHAEVQASAHETACAGCHPREVEEWRGSIHHASFTSADFQRSFHAEPREFCADCHAPLRTARGGRDEETGIGCLACHTPARGHAMGEHAAVATRSCQPCHDFDVPGGGAILQSTFREHQASAFAETTCSACHMSLRDGHRDHRFAVTRDAALLGRALHVGAAVFDGRAIVVHLATQGVGHRFPTGDLYRRLTVTLTAWGAGGAIVGGETFHLNRDWDRHRASLRSQPPEPVGEDNRLGDTPRELRIACLAPPSRVHVTVDYERGAGANGTVFDAFESLEILDEDLTLTR